MEAHCKGEDEVWLEPNVIKKLEVYIILEVATKEWHLVSQLGCASVADFFPECKL